MYLSALLVHPRSGHSQYTTTKLTAQWHVMAAGALLLVLLLSVTEAIPLSGPLNLPEKEPFNAFCEQTNIGDHIPGWCVPNTDPCTSWTGVACDGSIVESVVITGNYLQPRGVIPDNLYLWSSISLFALTRCNITGTFNNEFFEQSSRLFRFGLNQVPLDGTLPTVLHPNLKNTLDIIAISDTNFGGPLPSEFSQLDTLTQLLLPRNDFEGPLPDEWATMQSLSNIMINDNLIDGPLAEAWCYKPLLQQLDFSNNRLSFVPACFELIDPQIPFCSLRGNLFCEGQLDRNSPGPCQFDALFPGKLDRCGVCGGDGKSCIDCLGVLSGTSVVDACGVCDGGETDPQNCPLPEDCSGTEGGTLVYDLCDVCGGDGTTCVDCAGTPYGSAEYDQCDVCNGDGESCKDCSGVLFGTLALDSCNVCGGDNTSCADCAGVPNGTRAYDVCDVCGGDGTSCADCFGTPFGTREYDRCDVCGGDGTLCGLDAIQNGELGASSTALPIFIFLGIALAACLCAAAIYSMVLRENAGSTRDVFLADQRGRRRGAAVQTSRTFLLPTRSPMPSTRTPAFPRDDAEDYYDNMFKTK